MSDWEQFGSAPEDGEPTVVWRDDAGWFTAHFVAPGDMRDDSDDFECRWFTTGGEDLTGDLPSHWMRPTPPDKEETGQ